MPLSPKPRAAIPRHLLVRWQRRLRHHLLRQVRGVGHEEVQALQRGGTEGGVRGVVDEGFGVQFDGLEDDVLKSLSVADEEGGAEDFGQGVGEGRGGPVGVGADVELFGCEGLEGCDDVFVREQEEAGVQEEGVWSISSSSL